MDDRDFKDFLDGWQRICMVVAMIVTVLLLFRFVFVPSWDSFGDFAVFLFISVLASWYIEKR